VRSHSLLVLSLTHARTHFHRVCGWWMSDQSADRFRDALAVLLGCEPASLGWASREGLIAALACLQPPRLALTLDLTFD
jgi:hypothetical protein